MDYGYLTTSAIPNRSTIDEHNTLSVFHTTKDGLVSYLRNIHVKLLIKKLRKIMDLRVLNHNPPEQRTKRWIQNPTTIPYHQISHCIKQWKPDKPWTQHMGVFTSSIESL